MHGFPPAFSHIRTGLTSTNGATGRHQVLEPEAGTGKKASPGSTAADPVVEGREGAPQLKVQSHKLRVAHQLGRGRGASRSTWPTEHSWGAWVGGHSEHCMGDVLVRSPFHSKCGSRTSSTTWEVVRNTEPQALPDHLSQNPMLNHIHRCFLYTFKFDRHWVRRWLVLSH